MVYLLTYILTRASAFYSLPQESESWNFQVVLRKWAFLLLHVFVTFRDAAVTSKYLCYTACMSISLFYTLLVSVRVCCFGM